MSDTRGDTLDYKATAKTNIKLNEESDSDVSHIDVSSKTLESQPALENTKWTRHIWDTWGHPDKKHVKIIFKLDSTLLALACASTFIKYLDKINLSYAYVNGLKEDLGIEGNELNYANTAYNIASMICGFPAAYLMVKFQTKWLIIGIELLWIIITFCQSAIKTPLQMIVLRCLLGVFECGHYPALSFVLGTYYTPLELAKRAVILQSSTSIGSFFAGYVASGVYGGLNGVSGRAGWRWVFIIDGVISLGIIVPQILFFPDRLSNRKPDRVLNEEELAYLRARLPEQEEDDYKFRLRDIYDVLFTWEVWAFWFFGISQDIASLSNSAYLLWLKAWNKRHKGSYTVQQLDHYGSALYGVQTVVALASGWISDTVLRGRRWPPIVVAGIIGFVVNICLAALPVFPNDRGFRFFLYLNTSWCLATAGLYWAWAQEFFKKEKRVRVVVTGGINIGAFVANSICNNIWYKTAEMPNIPTGHYLSAVFSMLYSWTGLLVGWRDQHIHRRHHRFF